MKRLVVKWTVAVLALFVPSISVLAAQTKQTVSQVTSEVTLTGGVDYIVTSSTPFGTSGLVKHCRHGAFRTHFHQCGAFAGRLHAVAR